MRTFGWQHLQLLSLTFFTVYSRQIKNLRGEQSYPRITIARRRNLEFDCEEGCPLFDSPVCGIDQRTYMNECIAICQDVPVSFQGLCPGSRSYDSIGTESFGSERVSLKTMTRFQQEGFTLVSKRVLARIKINDNLDFKGPAGSETNNIFIHKPPPPRTVRISMEGYQYVSDGPIALSRRRTLQEGDPTPRVVQDRHRLAVIGTDERIEVANPTEWPNRINGEIRTVADNNGAVTTCSGTVLNTNKVLTAAHCVWDQDTAAFLELDVFSPGHNRLSGSRTAPFGSWNIDFVDTYQEYIDGDESGVYDMAMLTLLDQSGDEVGDVVGWGGLGFVDDSSDALQGSTITGYPGDKDSGSMWNSGDCTGSYIGPIFQTLVSYTCDTFGGMSGSSILDTSGYIYAVHFAGAADVNYGNLFVEWHQENVLAWSGRVENDLEPNDLTTNSPTEPPSSSPTASPAPSVSPTVSPRPTSPSAPSATSAPNAPSATSAPNAPSATSAPNAPNAPNVPSVPSAPTTPSTPSAPSAPSTPSTPNELPTPGPTTMSPTRDSPTSSPTQDCDSRTKKQKCKKKGSGKKGSSKSKGKTSKSKNSKSMKKSKSRQAVPTRSPSPTATSAPTCSPSSGSSKKKGCSRKSSKSSKSRQGSKSESESFP